MFNIYNEKSQNADDEQLYTIEWELAKVMLNSEQKVIIVEDFNAYIADETQKFQTLLERKH